MHVRHECRGGLIASLHFVVTTNLKRPIMGPRSWVVKWIGDVNWLCPQQQTEKVD
ncbi:hypothetical protein RMSM_04746 [Rhodopirellula maiorica SM1]|uniref:Uncharacterized protein n=1 Tax=Rhodopirellula maiorica SM1 TaxID=1265738 RepID=M5RG13_9BACT|nr:hypothetical protein RMSM_04746 [Rhodopirellula maiorica SM1]